MARELDELIPEVSAYAPTAPDILVGRAILDAAREFCEATRAWRVRDEFPVAAVSSEPIALYPDADVIEVEAALFNGRDLAAVTEAWLDEYEPAWRTWSAAEPQFLSQSERGSLMLVPPAAGRLELTLVLKPRRRATTLPDFLVNEFGRELAGGAVGILLDNPKAEYANPALATLKTREFRDWVARKKVPIAKGQMRARVRSRTRFL